MKKRRYLILLILLLALAACRSSKEMEEAALGETAGEATPVIAAVATATPEPPTPTSRPLWTATPTLEPVLPPEIVRSFDREQCPDHCWHDMMLGQSREELLAAIRNDPDTSKGNYFDGDYVKIEQFEKGRTIIEWNMLGLGHYSGRWNTRARAFLDYHKLVILHFPLKQPFPLQLALDQFGEPDRLGYRHSDVQAEFGIVTLDYLEL